MARWRELSEELDPEIREFAGQLRRLVDRSGLSIASLSDRTGYSRTSWERYLNGRLLAPKGAIIALAEVTRTSPVHLTTMWELAERAWSRSEMRHDMTMQAIRISQARAALGETGSHKSGGRAARRRSDAPAESSVPQQTEDPGRESFPPGSAKSRPGSGGPRHSGAPDSAPPGDSSGGPGRSRPGPRAARPRRRRSPVLLVLACVLVVAVAAVLTMRLAGGNAEADNEPEPTPTPTASKPALPAGVECVGDDCTGRDPEEMGCAGEYVETTDRATVGTAVVEIRWSETCQAAWARITAAESGDGIRITNTAGAKQNSTVGTTTDAYTPMVSAKQAADVTACGTLATGTEGCTQ